MFDISNMNDSLRDETKSKLRIARGLRKVRLKAGHSVLCLGFCIEQVSRLIAECSVG